MPKRPMVRASMLQGFITRDRRKESARESDQHLVDLEQAYAETFPEGAGEDGPGAEAAGFVLEDLFNEHSQFEAVLLTLRVLLGSGQPQEAQQLTDEVLRMFSKRGIDRRVPAAESTPAFPLLPAYVSTDLACASRA